MFTLTINQTDSRRDGDRVPQLLKDLRHIPARLDFDRSVEDEVQGIVGCPHQAVDAALVALRCGSWYVGLGVGPVNEPLPNQIKDAGGHGLIYARRAVDRLRNSKDRIPVAVEGPYADLAGECEAILRLLGHIVRDRSQAEWRVLDLLTPAEDSSEGVPTSSERPRRVSAPAERQIADGVSDAGSHPLTVLRAIPGARPLYVVGATPGPPQCSRLRRWCAMASSTLS
jgi:hypothetical protein